MALKSLFRRSKRLDRADALYAAIVAQSRRAEFYSGCGVPDTVDGRFDMIALHAFLVMRRLKGDGANGTEAAQELTDAIFADMDRSLREMGAGDLGVGRRVKAMAKGFYGRVAAYDHGIEAGDGVLEEALERNLFGTITPVAENITAIADYVRSAMATIADQPAEQIAAGTVIFGIPPDGVDGNSNN